jgi:hypothetical protein
MNLVFATAESVATAESLGVPEGRHDHSPAFQRRVHHGRAAVVP